MADASVAAGLTDGTHLCLPRIADIISNQFATAHAVYGADAPAHVWAAVKDHIRRDIAHVVRMRIRSFGLSAPVITGPPAPAPADPLADPDERIRGHLTALINRNDVAPNKISRRKVAKATNIPQATVGRSPVWRAFAEWRKNNNVRQVRALSLTEALLAVLPDRAADQPSDIAAENEIASLSADERDALRARLIEEHARDMAAESALPERRR